MSESTDHIAYTLQRVLDKLTEISCSLDSISNNIAQSTGVYNIDDVVANIQEATDKISGKYGYSISDLHDALRDIETNAIEINSKTQI